LSDGDHGVKLNQCATYLDKSHFVQSLLFACTQTLSRPIAPPGSLKWSL